MDLGYGPQHNAAKEQEMAQIKTEEFDATSQRNFTGQGSGSGTYKGNHEDVWAYLEVRTEASASNQRM